MNLKEMKDDFESQGYQDYYKWMMRCKWLIARLEECETNLIHARSQLMCTRKSDVDWIDEYFQKYGEGK